MGPADEEMILQQLKEIGIHKSKYFLNVLNAPTHSEFCFPAGTPPTGHDPTIRIYEHRCRSFSGTRCGTDRKGHGSFSQHGKKGL